MSGKYGNRFCRRLFILAKIYGQAIPMKMRHFWYFFKKGLGISWTCKTSEGKAFLEFLRELCISWMCRNGIFPIFGPSGIFPKFVPRMYLAFETCEWLYYHSFEGSACLCTIGFESFNISLPKCRTSENEHGTNENTNAQTDNSAKTQRAVVDNESTWRKILGWTMASPINHQAVSAVGQASDEASASAVVQACGWTSASEIAQASG